MTEAEWPTCDDPAPLMEVLRDCGPSERKLRLFACNCCRQFAHLLTDADRAVVAAIERCAEGQIPHAKIYETAGVLLTAGAFWVPGPESDVDVARVIREAASVSAWVSATRARAYAVDAVRKAEGVDGRAAEWKRQSAAIRCIFGNPFRPAALSPGWLTDTVLALARGMDESRDFSALPILADALQDAGCDRADLLAHCRGAEPHARGCWALDAVLGRQ